MEEEIEEKGKGVRINISKNTHDLIKSLGKKFPDRTRPGVIALAIDFLDLNSELVRDGKFNVSEEIKRLNIIIDQLKNDNLRLKMGWTPDGTEKEEHDKSS